MKVNKSGFAAVCVALLILLTMGCSGSGSSSGAPRNSVEVVVLANGSAAPWLTAAALAVNEQEIELADGKTLFVGVVSRESGEAIDALHAETPVDMWVPENNTWPALLAENGNPAFETSCQSLAESPLVIGMWQPIAEALGWPGRELGWLDIGSLAADPSAWSYYSGGQFGNELRIGHTHPGVSGSGASTLLAIVQAAQSTTAPVQADELQSPIVQASVGSFESAVTWFSPSTEALASTMRERGAGYLGAGIMYESDVLRYQAGDPALVPVYPFEGTFMATHPGCINGAAPPEKVAAAEAFINYLTGEEGQVLAQSYGLRPINSAVAIAAPLTEANGVQLNQPLAVYDDVPPSTVFAVQDLWQSSRKPINLVMLIDTSGSMDGSKMRNVREAAAQFAEQMGEEDFITLIAFSTSPQVIHERLLIGETRSVVVQSIDRLRADGDTSLYDAIGLAGEIIERTSSPAAANAMIVLTDGVDTISSNYRFDSELINRATANGTTVFTVAYGNDADEDILENLALQANGNYFQGNEADITAIYEEISLAFGGSVGIGR
ncbi:MAG: VWA domain-containing protein [Ardenticatenaceae bacterium]|nr:VWA domain-containing protein [Ardenticatenaceae bacterium]